MPQPLRQGIRYTAIKHDEKQQHMNDDKKQENPAGSPDAQPAGAAECETEKCSTCRCSPCVIIWGIVLLAIIAAWLFGR